MSSNLSVFRCINELCRTEFDIGKKLYQCPSCGDLLDIIKNYADLDPQNIKDRFLQRRSSTDPIDVSGVWRYREFLPLRKTGSGARGCHGRR